LDKEPSLEDQSLAHDTEVNTKFVIDSRYFAKGVGLILGGTVVKGVIKMEEQMMFGPDRMGNFRPVVIKGIHENRVGIEQAGEMASICVHVKTIGKNPEPIKNSHIRKGSCLINPLSSKIKGFNPYHHICVKYFDAHIKVLHHHTTI
jgi:GTPase